MNKFLSIILFVVIILSGEHSYAGAITDSEFSATTLASLNDITAKNSGGNPVGTIIAWPVAQNPEDMENWLECNGQVVNQATFPELYSIIGAHVPDLRGQFLRGLGGNSGTLGDVQNYGTYVPNATVIQTISGLQKVSITAGTYGGVVYDCIQNGGSEYEYHYVSSVCYSNYGNVVYGGQYPTVYAPGGATSFNSTQTISTGATETRPTNMAVRYLIRALP